MQRFLSFYVFGAVADALASNKPLQGSRHAEALVVEDSSVRLDHNGSERLDDVGGFVHWGKCSKRQLEGDWKPVHSDHCINANLVYVRIPKCASTSFSSVLRRISARYGVNGVDEKNYAKVPGGVPEPFMSAYHEDFSIMRGIMSKATLPIVKFTLLREPMERMLSQFYYVATNSPSVKDLGLLKFLQGELNSTNTRNNVMFSYLRSENEVDVHKVMDTYDFVGVTERFDESVVLLKEKLGLGFCDVMYSNGKIAEKSEMHDGSEYMEVIPFSKQPKEIQDYLKNEWQENQKLDFQAYNFAQQHMDKLIGLMGRDKFEAKVKDFTKWKEDLIDKCNHVVGSEYQDKVTDKNWRDGNCYAGDFGCGYKCFDDFCNKNSN